MRTSVIALCALALVLLAASAGARVAFDGTAPFTRGALESWLCAGGDATCVLNAERERVPSLFRKVVHRLGQFFTDLPALERFVAGNEKLTTAVQLARAALGDKPTLGAVRDVIRTLETSKVGASNASYPWFGFLPKQEAALVPGAAPVTYYTKCFGSITASATLTNPTTIVATFVIADQQQLLCADAYMIVGAGAISIQEFDTTGTYTVTLNASALAGSAAEQWYLATSGVRVFKFPSGLLTTIGQLIDTVSLIAGDFVMPLPADIFTANLDFVNRYVQASPRMGPQSTLRPAASAVALGINPDEIQSGDAILVLRPDGLDPMIGWGEGSNVGHSTIAIRQPTSGELFVCESTVEDGYWPTDGIQCHPWSEWVQMATAAQFNAVLVPLSNASRANFNTQAALDFFNSVEGVEYGYQVFLYGWLDTASNNFPCLPPDYTSCLDQNSAEVLINLIDKGMEGSVTNFIRQAVSHRTGIWPQQQSLVESLYYGATKLNMTFADIYTAPEQDSWMYNTTRNGVDVTAPAMVCCVFVCRMWKAGGLFGNLTDSINCGEQTLWDIYSMQNFASEKMGAGRPAICQQYDPTNQLCQLVGDFTLNLAPDVNTRPLYAHMGEKCSSVGPNYIREPGC